MPKAMGQCLLGGPEQLDTHFLQSKAARYFQPVNFLASVNGYKDAPAVRREMIARCK